METKRKFLESEPSNWAIEDILKTGLFDDKKPYTCEEIVNKLYDYIRENNLEYMKEVSPNVEGMTILTHGLTDNLECQIRRYDGEYKQVYVSKTLCKFNLNYWAYTTSDNATLGTIDHCKQIYDFLKPYTENNNQEENDMAAYFAVINLIAFIKELVFDKDTYEEYDTSHIVEAAKSKYNQQQKSQIILGDCDKKKILDEFFKDPEYESDIGERMMLEEFKKQDVIFFDQRNSNFNQIFFWDNGLQFISFYDAKYRKEKREISCEYGNSFSPDKFFEDPMRHNASKFRLDKKHLIPSLLKMINKTLSFLSNYKPRN